MIKIALNGARQESEGIIIPNTPLKIQNEVWKLFQSGFSIFHIHIYNDSGNESLAAGDVEKIIKSVREISAEIEVGISTGDWIEPDLGKRIGHIRSWKTVPDFASVNIVEENSIEVAHELIKKGIQIEAGITDAGSAEKFIHSGLDSGCLRILIEPEEQILKDALQTIEKIEIILDKAKIKTARLLHGFDLTAWDLLMEAFKKNYHARIGLEDIVLLSSGKTAEGNLELAHEALRIRSGMTIE